MKNYEIRITQKQGKSYIRDHIRKKDVLLSPEEWVRQHFIQYLVETLGYPASLIAVEKQIQLGSLKKRFDIIVYKQSEPFLLIECKAEHVALNQNVLLQTAAYNTQLKAAYIVLTNIKHTYCLACNNADSLWIDNIPAYE